MTQLMNDIKPLAILGGDKSVQAVDPELFCWPIVTREDEQAVLDVLRNGSMSGIDITQQFEREYAAWQGSKYALAHCNGTASLLTAMFGAGLGRGDEMIAPSVTYWASTLQCMTLGATPVFADIDPQTLCIDPNDIEHRINDRTRAIMVVHSCGHPCDMDAINAIAKKHKLKVIEDNSHAHGARYKGRMTGTLGDVAGASLMAGKSLAVGEGGMLTTDDRDIYQRAIAFAHYERHDQLTNAKLKAMAAPDGFATGLPLGAMKGRINQTCSAMGRVQLAHYENRIAEIQRAINRFWSLLEDVPGLRPHRPAQCSGSTMGGWYNAKGIYVPEELGGLPVERFCEAVRAEGVTCGRGLNFPLHLHPLLNDADVFGDGKPTRLAFTSGLDVRQPRGSLPVSEGIDARVFSIPWFKKDRPHVIARFAAAFRKVALQAHHLCDR